MGSDSLEILFIWNENYKQLDRSPKMLHWIQDAILKLHKLVWNTYKNRLSFRLSGITWWFGEFFGHTLLLQCKNVNNSNLCSIVHDLIDFFGFYLFYFFNYWLPFLLFQISRMSTVESLPDFRWRKKGKIVCNGLVFCFWFMENSS